MISSYSKYIEAFLTFRYFQNAAIGDFDIERPGLEIWCRFRYNNVLH